MSELLCFIDESGDHNLDLAKLDNQYNVFVLSGIIFKPEDYQNFDTQFKKLKMEIFGSDNFIIHTAEITRPKRSKDDRNFLFDDKKFRNNFYEKMNKLIDQTQFNIVSCTIRKDRLIDKYGIKAHNPYYIALENLINRVLYFCSGEVQNTCKIYPEKRGFLEDENLKLEFIELQLNGVKFHKGHKVRKHITEFELVDKKENLSGNQLADLVVSPIGRHIVGKPPKPKGNEVEYEILKSKFLRPDHFVVFP
jgi:hypothetical protein